MGGLRKWERMGGKSNFMKNFKIKLIFIYIIQTLKPLKKTLIIHCMTNRVELGWNVSKRGYCWSFYHIFDH